MSAFIGLPNLTGGIQAPPISPDVKPYRAIVTVNTAGSSTGALNSSGAIQSTTAQQTTTIQADCVVEEKHDDRTVVTRHPVEQGATITDHAYAEPSELMLTYGWAEGSNQNTANDAAFLNNLYQQFLAIRLARSLSTIYTGKRTYQNMLIVSLQHTTDRETEHVLLIRIGFAEILMATTQTVPITQAAVQVLPNKTAPVINQGNLSLQNAPNWNPNGAAN